MYDHTQIHALSLIFLFNNIFKLMIDSYEGLGRGCGRYVPLATSLITDNTDMNMYGGIGDLYINLYHVLPPLFLAKITASL